MLVGLCGYAGSGKDAVAGILAERYDYKRLAFADNVKKLALEIDPTICDNETFSDGVDVPLPWAVERDGWDVAKRSPQVRELLQRIGQGVRDIIGEDAWISAAMWDYNPHSPNTVITDVRYPNELATIRQMGGVVWWVKRPGIGPANGHASENSVSETDADWTVDN